MSCVLLLLLYECIVVLTVKVSVLRTLMPEFSDLAEHLELPQCTCLNAASDHTLRHCLGIAAGEREDPNSFLQSDADEELLIMLKFMSAVKISAISVTAPKESGPSSMKLFKNKVGLDFDSAKSDKANEELKFAAANRALPPCMHKRLHHSRCHEGVYDLCVCACW